MRHAIVTGSFSMKAACLTLDSVSAATRIFLDSTIFIYHATGSSPECRRLLERCEAGEVAGITSVVVLAEVAHRLMMIEASAAGLVLGKDLVVTERSNAATEERLKSGHAVGGVSIV